MITRRLFTMENPQPVTFACGNWAFWLTCSNPVLYAFVESLACVSWMQTEEGWHRARITISPLYDYEEAWLWIYEQLEVEALNVSLGAQWEIEQP